MKSFTAKEFSRCPAQVYEAARADGIAEVAHDRHDGCFHLYHVPRPENIIDEGAVIEISQQKLRVIPYKASRLAEGGFISSNGFICRVEEYCGMIDSPIPDGGNKIGDIAFVGGYRVILVEKAPD